MVPAGTRPLSIVAYSLLTISLIGIDFMAPVAAQSIEPAASAQRKAAPKAGKAEKSDAGASATNKPRDAGEVETVIATAQKALETGKADAAVSQIDALIARGGLEASAMARALALRGRAHKKQGRPAQAIADLQGALWIKNGLSEAERASVTEVRSEAYREAGLGTPAAGSSTTRSATAGSAATPSPAPSTVPSREGARAPTTPVVTAAIPTGRPEPAPPATSASSGLGGFFSNLFGSGAPKQPDPPPKEARPSPRATPATPAVSSWSESKIKQAPAPVPAPTPTAVAPPAKKPTVVAAATTRQEATDARPVEGYVLRLAAQRSPSDAKQVAERIKRAYAAEIGNRGYRIDESTFGSSRFYLADVGPFDDMEGAKALCASIRNSGTDCHVVSQ
jgi:SPOR domain